MHCCTRLLPTAACVCTILSLSVFGHVPQGTGEILQLYSYYTSTPPVVNGSLADRTTAEGGVGVLIAGDADEWKDAYVRTFPIYTADRSTANTATVYICNDDSWLYIGVSTNFNNLGNNVTGEFVFDQGAAGGNHNDLLDGGGSGVDNGEYRAHITTNSDKSREYSWNGSSWEAGNSAGSVAFVGKGLNVGTSLQHIEIKVPLNGGGITDDSHSFLDVQNGDELGFFLQIFTTNGSRTFLWHETNIDENDAGASPGWADIKLGVKRDFVTFYSTYNANGDPVIDGNIDGGSVADDAWRGSYRRDLVLTNFAGSIMNATLFMVEDAHTNDNLFVGLKVYDNDNNGGDYCQIYQEQNTTGPPADGRDFFLTNNRENALVGSESAYGASSDLHFSTASGGSWAADGDNANQNAAGAWYGSGSTHYEYEFLVNRNSGNADDINITDESVLGFLVKYHDADDGTDYFWEMSPNTDNIEFDANSLWYSAIGWPDLQLGAPYVQVIYPEDDNAVEGVVNIRIYGVNSGPADLDSAFFYRKEDGASLKTALTKVGLEHEWAGTWDVRLLDNGADTVVIEAWDNGLKIERLVNVTVANGTGGVNPPTISLTSPPPGDTISGTKTIQFAATPGSGSTVYTYVSIDGGDTIHTTTASTHTMTTTDLFDGSHTVQLIAVSSAGMAATRTITYIVNNSPSVSISYPVAGDTLGGIDTVQFSTAAVSPASLVSREVSIDGGPWSSDLLTTVSYEMETSLWPEGAHSVQVRAIDNNGRIGYSHSVLFHTYNTPYVQISAPSTDSVLSGYCTVHFTAQAVAPDTVAAREVFIDGASVGTATTGSTYIWNTTALPDGQHSIAVTCTSANGKSYRSIPVTYTLRNAPSVKVIAPLVGFGIVRHYGNFI